MIWQTGIHKVFVFWHTPYCISDFTYTCHLRRKLFFQCQPAKPQCQTVLLLRTSVLPLKRFKFLAAKIESTTTGSQANCDMPQIQLNKFLIEMHEPGQHPDSRCTSLLAWTPCHTWLSRWHWPTPTCCTGFSGIHRMCVFCLWLTDSRTPQHNDKITWDAGQTKTIC